MSSIACPKCSKPYLTEGSVVKHYETKHQDHSEIPVRCAECGEWMIKREYEVGENSFCSADCRSDWIAKNRTGENAPNWKGGESRRGRRWQIIADYLRPRDGECLRCGREKTKSGRRLHVHHITPEDEVPAGMDAHTPTNLVCVCFACHRKLEELSPERQFAELGLESRGELRLPEDLFEQLNAHIDEHLADHHENVTRDAEQSFIDQLPVNQAAQLSDFDKERENT